MISVAVVVGQVQAMMPEEARKALEEQNIEFTQESFFESLRGWTGDEAIPLFLAAGMDANSQDEDGFTALMMAVSFSYREELGTIRLLLDNGADINAKDHDGWTALMGANSAEIAQFLIDRGANINAKTKDGKPVSLIIAFRGNPEIVEVLQQAGLPVDDDVHKQALTVGILRAMATGLGSYQVDFNKFPAAEHGPVSANLYTGNEEDELTAYYAGQTVDMWETDIMYSSDGESYRLTSFGADKTEGDGSCEFDADIIFADGQLVAPAGLLN
jgi:ankyrin repeat protein